MLQEKAKIALHRRATRRFAKSMILIGLRGVGKTVLLNRLQRSLPLKLIGAGLPQVVGLAGRSASYAERLFDYPEVGPLSPLDARDALRTPVNHQGVSIDKAAVAEVIRVMEGYPYFLHQWGYAAWNIAPQASYRSI